ncbi:hypothetical protein B0H13DRAFT_2667191 [Mycena leptocephala]|nr:hypothetical protein B0H13DRAFT_2667191 [Mycena leptocephala]
MNTMQRWLRLNAAPAHRSPMVPQRARPPPYRWQRCQALLYPHLLLLPGSRPAGEGASWARPHQLPIRTEYAEFGTSGGEGGCGSVAARAQAEGEVDTLVDLLVPFQMVYEDGVERLAAESLLERQKWVNRIWEAVHRPLTLAESSAARPLGTPRKRQRERLRNQERRQRGDARAHREHPHDPLHRERLICG